METIWMRVGDQDDYRSFDGIADAATELDGILHAGLDADCHGHEITRYIGPALRGIEVEEYSGDNGISLFYGTPDAHFSRELTDTELASFTAIVQWGAMD